MGVREFGPRIDLFLLPVMCPSSWISALLVLHIWVNGNDVNTLNAVLCNKILVPHNCINYNRKYNLLMNLPMQSLAQLLTGGLENSLRNSTDQDEAVASEGMQDDRKIFRKRMWMQWCLIGSTCSPLTVCHVGLGSSIGHQNARAHSTFETTVSKPLITMFTWN
jgi:hypothetical protein